MSFKRASQLDQARLRRPVGDHLPSYFENLTDEQKRECLKSALHSIVDEMANEKDKWRLRALGIRKFELQEQMKVIRPKRKCPEVKDHLISAVREICGVATARLVMDRAVQMTKQATPNIGDEK